jgi:MFS family permease
MADSDGRDHATNHMTNHSTSPARRPRIAYSWEIIIWLFLAYTMNQADRQVFNVVLPLIEQDLGLTDVQIGFIGSALILTMAIVFPIAGYVGDRFSRSIIVVGSLFMWSIATTLSGFATGVASFIIIRSVAAGVGESLYIPAAVAFIGEHHVKSRSFALGIHQSAIYIGTIGGGFMAGWLGGMFGWHSAFFVFGGFGVLLAIVMHFRLKRSYPVRAGLAEERPAIATVLKTLVRIRTAVVFSVVLGGSTFVSMGYLTWMPTYLHNDFGLSLASAGFFSVFYNQIFAFIGVMLGGKFSDKVAQRHPRFRLILGGASLLLGIPFLYFMGASANLTVVYIALGGFGLCRGLFDSNIYASLFDVVPRRFHATAAGLMVAFSFIVGSLAPLALGAMKQSGDLGGGLSSLAWAYVLGGLALLFAAWRYFPREYIRPDGISETTAVH